LGKIPGRTQLVQSLFGGITVQQIVCSEDPKHVSQTVEPFYAER